MRWSPFSCIAMSSVLREMDSVPVPLRGSHHPCPAQFHTGCLRSHINQIIYYLCLSLGLVYNPNKTHYFIIQVDIINKLLSITITFSQCKITEDKLPISFHFLLRLLLPRLPIFLQNSKLKIKRKKKNTYKLLQFQLIWTLEAIKLNILLNILHTDYDF